MKKVSMSGSPRENVGKKDAKRLRREKMVPCVLYGGKDQIHFFTPEASFKDVVYTPEACLLIVEIDGKKFNAILQDIQYHPVSERILHADFLEIFDDKEVKMALPVHLIGNSPGVIKGGKMQLKLRKLQVLALPGDLPDFVEINISKMEIGDSVKVGDLSLDKVTLLDPESAVIVMVKSARAAMMAAVGDEAEEVEGEAAEEAAEGAEGSTEASEEEKAE